MLFRIALARTNLAFRDQPIVVLIAVPGSRRCSALQIEFVGAPANLFFQIEGSNFRGFCLLRNFYTGISDPT